MSSAATCRSSPREQPLPLARAIVGFLLEKRRTDQDTRDAIEREFRPGGVAAQVSQRSIADVTARAGA